MTRTKKHTYALNLGQDIKHTTIADAWFWFCRVNAVMQGDGLGDLSSDGGEKLKAPAIERYNKMLSILDKLFRRRVLLIDHFRVLKHYGAKAHPPRIYLNREARAATLWKEAMVVLQAPFCRQGLVEDDLLSQIKKLQSRLGPVDIPAGAMDGVVNASEMWACSSVQGTEVPLYDPPS